jgi:hypothetical protein
VVGSACCAGAGDGCAAWTGASVAGCAGRSTVFFGFGRTVWVRLGAGEVVAGVGLTEREGLLLARAAASLAPGDVPVCEFVISTTVTTTTAATAITAAIPHTADRGRPVQRRVGPSSPVTYET